MSVVSSRVSSVSSILKTPGIRSQLVRQSNRVYFKLPTNVKNIIYKYEPGNGSKDYDDLISILRETNIKDKDLLEFLSEVRQCVSFLGPDHKIFIETLLQIKWTDRSIEVANAYKTFLEDVICMQIYHTKCIMDNLVEQFKPENDATEWEGGICRQEDNKRLNHIHDILHKILKLVPMSYKILLQSLRARFPYIVHGTHTHEVYVHALLQILNYAPQLRLDILSLIINRLLMLDVNIPRSSSTDDKDDDMMEEGSESDEVCDADSIKITSDGNMTSLVDPMRHTLDVCMEQILNYVQNSCYVNEDLHIESLKTLYLDLLRIFERVILPTHATQYVQYIMFYICSFKPAIVEGFVEWLWRKTVDPNVSCVTRQSSVSYIASLLTTATFIPFGLVKMMQLKMSRWIHNYITMQDSSNYIDENTKEHTVFYSVCQALFFIIAVRHKEFVDSKNNMLFLQELGLPKIVTCKLNPLKACLPEIAHSFADVTRMYQLAYCYTIIENNTRNQLPIIQNGNHTTIWYDNFFPFGTYGLERSTEKIDCLFVNSTLRIKHVLCNSYYKDESIKFGTE